MPTFGPGLLKIGETATALDVTCLVNSFTIAAAKDEGDGTTTLCGTTTPGAITYTYSASGNLNIDPEDPDGLFFLSQDNPGAQTPFEFTPNNDAETSAAGVLILDPLDFGGEEYGETMNSDVEWTLVGQPTYTPPVAAAGRQAAGTYTVTNGRGSSPQTRTPYQPT